MWSYIPLEKMIDKTDGSIYKLVNLTAKRAMEIANGQPRLAAMDGLIKPSTAAMYEIAAGFIKYKKIKEADEGK